jgi:squalene-hopene/tetraprenyl-beta-curcumene cyclase
MLRPPLAVFLLLTPLGGSLLAAAEPVPPEGYPAPERNRKDEPLAQDVSLDRATAFLDASAVNWTRSRKCFTCHTNLSYLLARPLLSPITSGQSSAHDYVRGSLESIVLERWKAKGPRWPTEVVTAAAFLAFNDAHTTGKLHPASRQALDRMWTIQRDDGSWKWLKCDYPPMEIDDHYGVTIAAIGAGVAPDGYANTPQARTGLAQIKAYLAARPGEYLHHRAMVLWASSYLPRLELMTKAERDKCVADLLARQLPDGGWSAAALGEWDRQDALEQDAKTGDGYGTGFVVYVLRRAGLPASDPRLQKGVAWIKTHQRASGRWFTPSLVRDGAHYLTQAGTAYACMALYACGETPGK